MGGSIGFTKYFHNDDDDDDHSFCSAHCQTTYCPRHSVFVVFDFERVIAKYLLTTMGRMGLLQTGEFFVINVLYAPSVTEDFGYDNQKFLHGQSELQGE